MLLRAVAATCLLLGASHVAAQSAGVAASELGPHRGSLQSHNDISTETVIGITGIRVYFYDSSGQPIDATQGRGMATASVEGNNKRYRYSLLPADDHSLSTEMDLSHMSGKRVKVDFHTVGIPGSQQRLVFQENITVASPAISGQTKKLVVQQVPATLEDTKAIVKQAVCPVMDEPLGSMGHPIKMLVDGKPIFLCCKGCIKRVQADPAKYLAMVHVETPEKSVPASSESIRPGVYKVTAADAPFIAAQKICPVMEEPLDAMGGPYKVDAGGKAVYICCPGCAKLIIADPGKYIAMLAEQGVEVPTIRR
jgi:YHS domain-containing protein